MQIAIQVQFNDDDAQLSASPMSLQLEIVIATQELPVHSQSSRVQVNRIGIAGAYAILVGATSRIGCRIGCRIHHDGRVDGLRIDGRRVDRDSSGIDVLRSCVRGGMCRVRLMRRILKRRCLAVAACGITNRCCAVAARAVGSRRCIER